MLYFSVDLLLPPRIPEEGSKFLIFRVLKAFLKKQKQIILDFYTSAESYHFHNSQITLMCEPIYLFPVSYTFSDNYCDTFQY